MSADLLRRAATKLRELATAAQHNEPWCSVYTYAAVRHVQRNADLELNCHDHGQECGQFGRYDGSYVAMMHPPVALALAECMDKVAWMVEFDAHMVGRVGVDELIAVARAILREEPS